MQTGYICLHRAIQENKFYFSERFTKMGAWIDLLLLARHKAGVVYFKGIELKLNRGDVAYSMLSLAERWHWDRKTVKKYLSLLQGEGMIRVKHSRTTTTVISIVKYDYYQRPEGHCQNADIRTGLDADNRITSLIPIDIRPDEPVRKTTDIGIEAEADNGLDNGRDMNKNERNENTIAMNAIKTDERTNLPKRKLLDLKIEPAPRVGARELLLYFAECHEQRTGAPYMIAYGKEGAAFKAMLATYGPDKMREIINAFFQSKDEFILKAGFTVGVMRSQINKLAASLAVPTARLVPKGVTATQMFYQSQQRGTTA